MAMGQIFDTISTGDILGGGINIGTQGLTSADLKAIFGSQAEVEVIQAARERQERKKRTQLLAISGSVIVLFSLFIFLFFYSNKNKTKP